MSKSVSCVPGEMSTALATRDVRWLPLPYVLLDDQWFGRKWRRCRPSYGFGRDGAPPAPLRAGDPLLPETRKVLGGFKQICRISGGAVRCGFCSCRAQVQPSGHQGHGPADVMWRGARCRGGTPRSQGRRDRGGSTSGCGEHPGMSRTGGYWPARRLLAGWVQSDLCSAEAARRSARRLQVSTAPQSVNPL